MLESIKTSWFTNIRMEVLAGMTVALAASHVWDQSAVTAIARTVDKYRQFQKEVTIVGLNAESERLVERIGLAAPSGH